VALQPRPSARLRERLDNRVGTFRRRINGYVFAVAATVALLVLRLALGHFVDATSVFLFFAPAVMLSAWYGGRGPGLLATAASTLAANYFLLAPTGSFSNAPDDLTKMVVFLLVGGQISWLSGALHEAKRRAELNAAALKTAHDHLEMRVRERTAELQFQTAMLRAQSDASLDGILVATHEGQIIFRNRRLSELWGLPDEAFTGTRDQAVLAMRGELAHGRQQDPLGGGADLDEPRVELPAGLDLRDGRMLECYGAPVNGADGQSYGRAWFFRDVTERRRTALQILEAGERERHRIGQDLHDDLCQHLAGIGCLGRVLQQRLDNAASAEAEAAGRLVDLVEQAVRRARDIARGLQPLQLETDGLGPALIGLATDVEQMFAPVRCHVTSDGPVLLGDLAAATQVYRITQEAISNAIRHGRASNVYIDLSRAGERLILTVEDDGVGIADAGKSRPGLGMRTMRHRARMISASLSVEPGDGGGTVVTCTLAAHRPDAAAAITAAAGHGQGGR
jgi:signal transduction histidine kinase